MRRAVAAAVAASAILIGLAPTLRGQQVFPSEVELVAVDVTVVNRDGRPATDLQPGDFVVSVGGRSRRVVAAQLLRHVVATPSPAAPPSPTRPPDFNSNQLGTPGRLIVLVPDVGSLPIAGARAVAEAMTRFLGLLDPHDRLALRSIPVGPLVDFTIDHARVAVALRELSGAPSAAEGTRAQPVPNRAGGAYNVSLAEAYARFAPMGDRRLWCAAWEREVGRAGVSGVGSVECPDDLLLDAEARRIYAAAQASSLTTTAALLQLLRGLARLEGPKVVVLVGQGLATGASGGELGGNRRLAEVADAAAAARAAVYTIQVDRHFLEAMDVAKTGMPQTTYLDQQLLADGLEAIAGYTGGALLRTTISPDVALERVAAETSATWLLSFEPEADDRDGQPHDIRVLVKRERVEVRARPRFVVEPADADPASAIEAVRQSLEMPLLETDVPLAVAAYVLGASEGRVQLLVAGEVELGAEAADAAAVGYRIQDERGALVAGAIETGRLEPLRSARVDAAYYLCHATVPPGRFTVKLAVAAASGRTGSVEEIVEARLVPARDMELSSLVVAEPGRRASGLALSVDGRLFGRTVRSVLEVCGASSPPGVQFEMAPPGAPPCLLANARVSPAAEAGCYSADVSLDLTPLAPGRYELRAVAYLPEGGEAGRMARLLEIPERR